MSSLKTTTTMPSLNVFVDRGGCGNSIKFQFISPKSRSVETIFCACFCGGFGNSQIHGYFLINDVPDPGYFSFDCITFHVKRALNVDCLPSVIPSTAYPYCTLKTVVCAVGICSGRYDWGKAVKVCSLFCTMQSNKKMSRILESRST